MSRLLPLATIYDVVRCRFQRVESSAVECLMEVLVIWPARRPQITVWLMLEVVIRRVVNRDRLT